MKDSLCIVAKELQFLFPEGKAAKITHIDLSTDPPIVEGILGRGTFALEINVEDLDKIIKPRIPVVSNTPDQIILSDHLEPVEIDLSSEDIPQPKVFIPPDTPWPTRQKLTRPGEKELLARFEAAYANPWFGKRKLSPEQVKAKAQRDSDITRAKNLILNGESYVVEKWIKHLL
jgi:hypothetical protein